MDFATTVSPLINGLSTFALIFIAELGDKSQLVCMALAAQYRARSVLLGAISAFMLLNALAVVVGMSFSQFIPEVALKLCAAGLLLLFAWKTWQGDEQDQDDSPSKLTKGVALSTFLLIIVAEMGDKTQLAVATISMTQTPVLVWLSATLALTVSCVLGVYAGKRWLSRLDEDKLKRVTTLLFIAFSLMILSSLVF
ncbi:TMEM165/GDT1 family protein [Thalassotalea ponticola]|uniref:TMEM165/GDT1 family protein n=1 Tax=Thalassotalea ponticola TaxID=1523392 RepID=UPI0025B42306|nr:TMEM165/GDT1 family protein [Thalassotalea ponticola]MDN3651769.1 TMEM165/GDT1 family protein [Thalassotalea ponticola]